MSFLAAIRVALGALLIHKGRSALTSLGIVIGIGAVIALVSAGTGARLKLDEQLLTVGGRWDEVPQALAPLDYVADRGGRLAGALAAAIREEMAAAQGGRAPGHLELRALGYVGLSEVVRFRASTAVTSP